MNYDTYFELANKFIKDPNEVVKLQQAIKVKES